MGRAHDVGGLKGLGPVEIARSEPTFHETWEARIFGITLSTLGKGLFSVEEFRAGIEGIPAIPYLRASYYERWIATCEQSLARAGVLSEDEVDARAMELSHSDTGEAPHRDEPEFRELLLDALRCGMSPQRKTTAPRRFAAGDPVRAVGTDTTGHTRLPRYIRGKRGVVVRCDDAFVFPDSNALGHGENPEWCYCVRFESGEVWGDVAETRAPVYVDVWESYLEPA